MLHCSIGWLAHGLCDIQNKLSAGFISLCYLAPAYFARVLFKIIIIRSTCASSIAQFHNFWDTASYFVLKGLCWKLRHTQYSRSHRMMVLGATDRLSCIVSLSKFYSSGDPLFLGHSPSPAFSAVV